MERGLGILIFIGRRIRVMRRIGMGMWGMRGLFWRRMSLSYRGVGSLKMEMEGICFRCIMGIECERGAEIGVWTVWMGDGGWRMEDIGVIISWGLSLEGLCLVLSNALGFLYVKF
jgi:hypothetical protein